jgi:flavin-dependent dehydrogenase
MSDHTPGPWEPFDESDKYPRVYSRAPELVGDVVCLAPTMLDESMSYWKANARLIAAAPDLLDAAEDVASDSDRTYDDRNVLVQKIHFDKLLAAIARAKGGEA